VHGCVNSEEWMTGWELNGIEWNGRNLHGCVDANRQDACLNARINGPGFRCRGAQFPHKQTTLVGFTF